MKKLLIISALAIAAPAHAVSVIVFAPGAAVPLPGATVIEDFEDEAPNSSIGTNANVYSASVGGIAAKPAFGSDGQFAAVLANGSYTNTFAKAASVFSFALGSLDSYNRLTLFFAGGGSQVFNGNQINNGPVADGNQIGAGTNGRVSFFSAGGPKITGAQFESLGSNSFEFDNLAVAGVPEPTTWAMMLIGFAAVGFGMRRKKAVGNLALA